MTFTREISNLCLANFDIYILLKSSTITWVLMQTLTFLIFTFSLLLKIFIQQ